MSEEEKADLQPRINRKTWGEFVVAINRKYSVLPDVGSRSVNDVLEDVTAEILKNVEKQGEEIENERRKRRNRGG